MKRPLAPFIVVPLPAFVIGVLAHTAARFLFGCGALGECSGSRLLVKDHRR